MRLVCLGILLSFVLSFAQVSVEVKDEQTYNPNMLGLRARVVNSSGQSYDNVTVNILFKKNDASEIYALDAYYTEGWNCTIAEQSGEYVVVKMVIPHLGTGTSPNGSGVSVGIHRTGWQPLPKSSENGYPSGIAFTTALNYSVYQGNVLIGGTSYTDPSSVVPSLRFVGVQPEDYIEGSIPAWIEIENYGTTPADLSKITLEWPTNTGVSSSVVSSAVLQPGKRLRVCTVQLTCPDDDVVAAVPTLPMGATGEILLRYNGAAKDYLSWGLNEEKLASDMHEANIQYTRIRYDKGKYDEYWHIVQNGVFYKKIDEKWYSYPLGDNVNTVSRPNPIPYINEESLCMEASDLHKRVRFAWHPVEYASGYNLTVKKSDGTVVLSQHVNGARYDVDLEEGTYEWSVSVDFINDTYVLSNPWMDHYTIWKVKNVTKCTDVTNEHYLQVPQYGVHKDTRMLVPNWGELAKFPDISWDHSDVFVYNSVYEYSPSGNPLFLEVDWRCWAVGVQILNHYYGGDLTQDEIKFYGKTVGFQNLEMMGEFYSRPERDKIIAPFGLGSAGGGNPAEIKATLMWALNITDPSQLVIGFSTPNAWGFTPALNLPESIITTYIDQGRPLYVGIPGHIMILDGYRYASDNLQIHLVNLYNGGESEWFNNSNVSFIMYIVPPVVTNPRMSDSRVHEDSDEDGIVDFDEDERFPTSANKSDSDEDGIDDKVEIFSYTIKEHFVENLQCYNPGTNSFVQNDYHIGDYLDDENGTLCRYEIYADIDGDGNRAEMDVDSDHLNNDGLPDGVEDLNHNGYVDNGETDPYNFSDDGAAVTEPVETVVWDAPSLVAIYAFEGINVGDNVTCNSGMHGYCQIASESALQYYAVSLGTNSTFGGVFSKGGVQLRDNSHIVGDVSIYSLPTNSISPELAQGSSVTGATDVRTVGEWPFAVSDNAHHSLENKDSWENKTVYPGQTLVLNGDDTYRNLTVQAGGTLKLGAGTIKVGNITMEWGSRLEFVNPGRETVLIVDGYVNWRAQIVNSDLQTVAKGFKLIQYAPGYIHIEGDWAGTIHARWSELTLGQVKKTAYGSFVAKKVYLGNGLVIYRVHFDPIPLTNLV